MNFEEFEIAYEDCKKQGLSNEQIINLAKESGTDESVIRKYLSDIEKQFPRKSNKNKYLKYIILFGLVLIIAASFFIVRGSLLRENQELSGESIILDETTEKTSLKNDEQAKEMKDNLVEVVSEEAIYCDDFKCLAEAVENGEIKKASITTSVSLFGAATMHSTQEYIVEPTADGYRLTTKQGEIEMESKGDFELPEESLDSFKIANEALVGKDGECLFSQEDLLGVLKEWEQGNLNMKQTSHCTGELYETQIIEVSPEGKQEIPQSKQSNESPDIFVFGSQEAIDMGQKVKRPPMKPGDTFVVDESGSLKRPQECPACENCKSGMQTFVYGINKCQDCLFDSGCKNGFICSDKRCMSPDTYLNKKVCHRNNPYNMVEQCEDDPCPNCQKKTKTCVSKEINNVDEYRCVECGEFGAYCAKGFTCVNFECVAE